MDKTMEFTVTLQEVLVQDFYVEATTAEEAIEVAIKKYSEGDFVLEPGEVITRAATTDGSPWREF
jgi:hypothetical protein